MSNRPDPRRVARLVIPPPLREGDLAHRSVHALDLSLLGARIHHQALLHDGVVCYLDLPPALVSVRLLGRVVWTRLRATEQTLDGDRQALYESGLEFTSLTAEQRITLADAVAILQAAQTGPEREPSE